MRVLVTGHKGYIGTVMVPMLLAQGYDVVGLDSDLYRQCTFGDDGIARVPELLMDIRDVGLADLFGYDAIIHLAALSNDPLGDLNPQLTCDINYRASARLARLAKKAGVRRFLFSSSCSTYGAAGDDLLTECAAFNPVTPYGRSKVLAEQAIAKLADANFSPTFLRNATAYGVSPRLRFDLVLNNLVSWAYTTSHVHLKSDGSPWRPIVHIEDISRAFIAVLRAPVELVYKQAFNVGINSENYQIRDLARIVQETMPDCDVEFADNACPDKRNYRVDCSKLTRILADLALQWTAAKGARQIYAAIDKNGLRLDEFEGPRYKRVDHIKYLLKTGRLDETLRWKNQVKHAVA
ncbi:SDR family oxidoreductase [candidate division KSB1 bacterium]|nr:SDR family oxidoreductase [candidate division KSB1 bacterium]RQW10702.1 MAG: SDR family oxidoreductase [candidate division KSB1 bacterium]